MGATGNIGTNPFWINPAGDDYYLSAGSPCIDAGDDSAMLAGVTTDFEGGPRLVDDITPNTDDGVVDMGADER